VIIYPKVFASSLLVGV